jgi:orotate phosphoribosyltransferase
MTIAPPLLYDRSRLIELVKEYALSFGDFTLASGAKANFYLDCRKLTLSGEGANQIAAGILELLDNDMPDAVGGMAIGADPITAAVITRAWQAGLSLRGFIVRKENKQHGTGRQVEGPIKENDRVVMLEDVVTSGGSSLKAIQHARDFGLKVDRIITIIDRKAGGRERFEAEGVAFHSLLTLDDLGIDT